MVPPVVERKLDGKVGAAVYWVENIKGWDMKKPVQGPEPGWSKQISRMKLFDLLIGNIDRNQGNLIYDSDWHLFLIDHSRAFTNRKSLDGIAPLITVDREAVGPHRSDHAEPKSRPRSARGCRRTSRRRSSSGAPRSSRPWPNW